MTIAAVKTHPNAAGAFAAVVPCGRPVKIGPLAIEIIVFTSHVILRVGSGWGREQKRLHGDEINQFIAGGFRFRYLRPLQTRDGLSLVFNVVPVH